MYPPRYVHHNYRMPVPVGPFGSKWPMQHRNRPTNYHSKRPNNFQPQTANEEHWCETCDRGFPTLQVLESHKKQHQKCNIDGCQFVAHPKVITKHIQMQHSTGLYKKIANLNRPEDIKKWREERKSRYPTRENIEKKVAEIKEKVDRGEKMGMKQCREHKSYKTDHGTKRKFDTKNNQRQNFKRRYQASKCSTEPKQENATANLVKKPRLPQRDNKLILPINDHRTLKPFTGILHLLDENEEDNITEELTNSYTIEDEEYAVDESNETYNSTISEPVVCGALSSLMSNYESSDDESTHEVKVKHNIAEDQNKSNLELELKPENVMKHNNVDEKNKLNQDNENDECISHSDNLVKYKNAEDHNKTLVSNNIELALKPENLLKHNNVDEQNKSTHEDISKSENVIKYNAEDKNKTLVPNCNIPNNDEKSDDESGPEEVKILKIPDIKENKTEPSKCNINDQKQMNCNNQKKAENVRYNNVHKRNNTVNFKPKLPSTLLEKLLCNEIRQERNIVLQCIRHIVKCNYFEKTVENK